MKLITYSFALLLIVIGVSFAILNANNVAINLYWTRLTLPLSLIIALAFVIGGVLGMLSSFIKLLRYKAEIFSLNRKVHAAEKELASIREKSQTNNDFDG